VLDDTVGHAGLDRDDVGAEAIVDPILQPLLEDEVLVTTALEGGGQGVVAVDDEEARLPVPCRGFSTAGNGKSSGAPAPAWMAA
jgi:hypothetical protein